MWNTKNVHCLRTDVNLLKRFAKETHWQTDALKSRNVSKYVPLSHAELKEITERGTYPYKRREDFLAAVSDPELCDEMWRYAAYALEKKPVNYPTLFFQIILRRHVLLTFRWYPKK